MPDTGRLILATWSGYLLTGSATEYLLPATYPLPPAAVTEYLVLAAPHLPLATENRGRRSTAKHLDPRPRHKELAASPYPVGSRRVPFWLFDEFKINPSAFRSRSRHPFQFLRAKRKAHGNTDPLL